MSTDIAQVVRDKREEILRISASHGAHNVRIFGSVARGEAGADSDVDFLVDMGSGRTLLDLAHLFIDLEDLLGCKVDVVAAEGLHWYIRERVMREATPL